jgi:dTDP-4-dehydrorhamnose reductase
MTRPDAVVNAIGIVKQRNDSKEAIPSIEVNALFPHRLAQACKAAGARLVHMSTDCVFSGRKGQYSELDLADAEDLYGRSKYLGEVHDPGCLTLRTSIIGLEINRKTSLIEWFLSQKGTIRGFRRAIYSGLTTQAMADAIEHFLTLDTHLSGVWHLSSTPIDKYELLTGLSRRLGRTDITIEPDETFVCDRSLSARALFEQTAYRPPSWDAMLDGLAKDINERNHHVHA